MEKEEDLVSIYISFPVNIIISDLYVSLERKVITQYPLFIAKPNFYYREK